MANVKITDLTELAAVDVATNDVLPIVDINNDSTKKVTIESLTTSVAAANDFATYTILTANIDQVSSNADAFNVQLNANIDAVQSNVSALSSVLRISNTGTTDDVTVGSDDLIFAGTNGLTPLITDDTVTFQLDDTAVTAGLYGGVEGTTTNVAVITVDAQGRITAASNATVAVDLATLESNVNTVQDNVVLAEANVTAVETRRADNVFFTYNATGDQANVIVNGANVEPSQNNVFSLGAPDRVWKDLYVGPGSIKLGNVTLSAVETGLKIEDAAGDTTQIDTSVANVTANLNLIQDNVNQVSQDVSALESRRADNVTIRIDAFTGTNAAIESVESRVNSNLDVTNDNVATLTTTVDNFGTSSNANAAALAAGIAGLASVDTATGTETRLNANLDLTNDNVATLTTTVDNFGTYANTNLDTKANVSATYFLALANDFATYSLLNANLDVIQDNVATLTTTVDNFGTSSNANATALAAGIVASEVRLNANLDLTNDNVITLTTTVDNFGTSSNANAAALASGIVASEVRVNANLDLTNDNVANITDGTTPFSAPVTFTDNVTISGSLIVTGAQVDLGVQSATVDNNFIELSAELSPGDVPATDSGLLINRGNKGNVFIGDHLGEDGVIFVRTQSPDTNTTVAIESFMDVHANMFHAAGPTDLGRVHFGLRDAEDTGIIVDDAGANINFVADGAYVANVHFDGTLNSQNAIIAPAIFSDGVELQANDSATLFSARANDFATYTHITANVDIVQDNVAQNATDISAVEARRTANIAGAVSTITTSDLTASRALASDGSGKVAVSAVTSTELGYLDGVTSAIQTQIDSKSSTANAASLAAGIATNAGDISTNESTRSSNSAALAAGIATKLDSADYTASDVLTKIKTVDGAGSGLDADLLDGQTSTYFAVEATRSSNAAALAAGIAGITPIGTSDISNGAVTIDKLAATLDLGALS